jgi:hypothetical protein
MIAVGLGFAATGGGCVVDLEHVLACGDGYVDALAGEECEPNLPESYENGCVGTTRPFGNAACDPETCEIVATELQCARCGDEFVDADAGEECDGRNNGAVCPDGVRSPGCTPECTIAWESCGACGNGVTQVDVGEECDPMESGGFATPRLCAGDDPLDAPNPAKPYASGTAVSCTSTCEYDRRDCGYCGDGVRDDALPLSRDGAAMSWPELCDGDDFDEGEVADAFPWCAAMGARADITCDDDCLGFTPRSDDCCLPSGTPCDEDGELRCCAELANPEGGAACLPVLSPDDDSGSGGDATPRLCR